MPSPSRIEPKTKQRRPKRASVADVMAAYRELGVPLHRIVYDRANDVVFALPENESYDPAKNDNSGELNEWTPKNGRRL